MNFKKRLFKYWIKCYCYNNTYILWAKRNIRPAYLSNLLLLVTSPYILVTWVISIIYEGIIGKKKIHKFILIEESKQFKHDLAMVSISKNEGPYIKEWIDYHKLIGFTKFYFYDNESNDDTQEILKPYIKQGVVEYTLILGKARQLDAYNDAINKHKNECRWMAFMDMDEYLMPMKPENNIIDILHRLTRETGAAGIGINWAVFGSSGHTTSPNGLIIENFTHRSTNMHWTNFHIKTICNPRLVKNYISPHYPLYKLGAYSIGESNKKRLWGWFCHDVNYQNIRINHYFTKSKEQYIQKRARGLGDRIGQYDLEKFNLYDLNDIEDNSMKYYAELLKKQQ